MGQSGRFGKASSIDGMPWLKRFDGEIPKDIVGVKRRW